MAKLEHPNTPCNELCEFDSDDVCVACFRTAEEVDMWAMYTAREKHEVLVAAARRRAAQSSQDAL